MQRFDYLVIGGGIAGLTFALKVAHAGKVAILFKKAPVESSTAWAQGGVAAVTSHEDSYALHIEDTLVSGANLCDKDIVSLVVNEGPERIAELVKLGARFDKDHTGSYDLHREGGHSRRRIFHTGDTTGFEIQRALLQAVKSHPNIELKEYCSAIDLITSHKLDIQKERQNQVIGAYVLQKDKTIDAYCAAHVMIATGGAGKTYLYTTNPDVATGDGLAMCYRVGCRIANMEFFQFHPTCLYHPKAKTFLITEAMRGEGARLLRMNGQPFMEKYHELRELAPRDIVARAIDNEMKTYGEDYVLLDISFKGKEFLTKHFPMIYDKCLEFGIDIAKDPIPVVPAAHYCCGGVLCDEFGRTDIKNLYVAGEVACTGLHGANRLASNSLLEGLVFGERASRVALENTDSQSEQIRNAEPRPWIPGNSVERDEEVVITQNWDEIRRCMWNYVGIVRTTKRLERALRRIELIQKEVDEYYKQASVTSDLLELRNLSLVAELVIRCAMQRRESRGLHYSLDYPATLPVAKDTVLQKVVRAV